MYDMTVLPFPEDDRHEFKECVGSKVAKLPEDLWQSISAFANSHGGTIYLGVNDVGEAKGLTPQNLDSLQKDLSTLVNNGYFNRKPSLEIKIANGYLEVEVKEAEFYNKPIYSHKVGPKKIYVRQGSTNVVASEEEMRSLFAGAKGGGENQPVEGDPLKYINISKLDEYISRTGLSKIELDTPNDKLSKIKALRDDKLTMFGLVAFGCQDTIDSLANNIYIDFRRFAGTSKVDPTDPARIYLERHEFHGDVRTQFQEAFSFIKSKLPTESFLNIYNGLREERHIIPEDAIREALANALAHRDYLLQSSCVNIDLYDDRIEFINPGESLVAIDNLENTPSKARNPNLIEYLKAYQITDKSARGIPTILQAARSRGLLSPKFENISGNFKATLYFSSPHSNKDKEWVAAIGLKYGLNDTQQNALVYVKNEGSITNRKYCEINRMEHRNDDKKARRELAKLVEKGLLKQAGAGAGTKYVSAGATYN